MNLVRAFRFVLAGTFSGSSCLPSATAHILQQMQFHKYKISSNCDVGGKGWIATYFLGLTNLKVTVQSKRC